MSFVEYWRLIDTMARMALRADASRFFLGYVWWVLEPLLFVLVFYAVFDLILDSRQPDFLFFLMTGKLPFIWFSKAVNQASNSVLGGAGLIGKLNLPKTLFPMAVIQESVYRQVSVFLMLFVVLFINGYTPTATWFYLLPLLAVYYVMIVSCSYVGACLVCIVRDFSMIIPLGMIFLMFTSGIFWNVHDLGSQTKSELILMYNPMAFVLDCFRQILLYNSAPDMLHLAAIGALFGALLCIMVLIMRRSSQYLALRALTA